LPKLKVGSGQSPLPTFNFGIKAPSPQWGWEKIKRRGQGPSKRATWGKINGIT
jgi:hypothetical protein